VTQVLVPYVQLVYVLVLIFVLEILVQVCYISACQGVRTVLFTGCMVICHRPIFVFGSFGLSRLVLYLSLRYLLSCYNSAVQWLVV